MNAPLSPKARDAYRLWQLCFGDTDAFLSSYFSEVYRDDSTLIGYTEGVATTHLQYLPVELSSGGERLPVSYVVAVCTHPDYAGRGLMKEMLKEALRLARERGDVASLLLPAEDWLFDYYAKAVGYAPIPVAVTTTSLEAVLSESDPECEGATLVEYLTAVERTNKAPQLLHSPALWRVVTEDYPTSEGYVLREHRTAEGKVNGALFYVEREDEVVVQAIYGSSAVREVLLQELSHSAKKVSYYLRPEGGRGVGEERRGMIRLLDPLRFLQHLATLHSDLRGAWAYSDELFPALDGLYIVEGGVVRRPAYPTSDAYPKCRTTAELLAQLGKSLGEELSYSLRLFFEAV